MSIKEKLGTAQYHALLSSALVCPGHPKRITALLQKLKNNMGIRFVTLGGSITEGLTSKGKVDRPYGSLIHDFLSHKLYGTRQVEFFNLGISCSFTLLGLMLVESHIIDLAPDLIILDFSLNDNLDQGSIFRFESLIRKLLNLPSCPAIIILTLQDTNHFTAAPYMMHIGQHYAITVINVGNALVPYFNDCRLCWSDYAIDTIHPHQLGHQLIADCIHHYFEQVHTLKSNTKDFLPSCCFSAPYENMHFLSARALYEQSETNFMLTQNPDFLFTDVLYHNVAPQPLDSYLRFSLNCSALIFLFFQSNDPQLATATVCVDTHKIHFLQGYCQFVYQFPKPLYVLEEPVTTTHNFELRITDEDSLKNFYLLGVGWY